MCKFCPVSECACVHECVRSLNLTCSGMDWTCSRSRAQTNESSRGRVRWTGSGTSRLVVTTTTTAAAAASADAAAWVAVVTAGRGRDPRTRHTPYMRTHAQWRLRIQRGAEAVKTMKNDLDHEGDQCKNEPKQGNEKGSVDIWKGEGGKVDEGGKF